MLNKTGHMAVYNYVLVRMLAGQPSSQFGDRARTDLQRTKSAIVSCANDFR